MAAWDIVTVEECVALLGYAEELYQDAWYEWVEALIKRHLATGTLLYDEDADALVELYSGDGTPILSPRSRPIVSVVALKAEAGSGTYLSYPDSGYYVHKNYIELAPQAQTTARWAIKGREDIFPKGVNNVELTYKAGLQESDNLYQLVKMAMAQMINLQAQVAARGGADAGLAFLTQAQPMGDRELRTDVAGLHKTLMDVLYTLLPRQTRR